MTDVAGPPRTSIPRMGTLPAAGTHRGRRRQGTVAPAPWTRRTASTTMRGSEGRVGPSPGTTPPLSPRWTWRAWVAAAFPALRFNLFEAIEGREHSLLRQPLRLGLADLIDVLAMPYRDRLGDFARAAPRAKFPHSGQWVRKSI